MQLFFFCGKEWQQETDREKFCLEAGWSVGDIG